MSCKKILAVSTCFDSAQNWVYTIKFDVIHEKTFILSSGHWKNSFLIYFDGKNPFFLFHTHDFQGSKQGLKGRFLGCKHYYALFRYKWRYWTQKSQNSFYKDQVNVHCDVTSNGVDSVDNDTFRYSKYYYTYRF